MVKLIKDDDVIYQDWLKTNPDGFVVNTPKNIPPSYLVLHRVQCRLIKQYNNMAQPGGFTERQYVKICGNTIDELRVWIKRNLSSNVTFSKTCTFCKPD